MTERSAVGIEIRMRGSRITRVDRNTDSLKMEIITEHGISIVGIERRIADESLAVFELRVFMIKIR